MADTSAAEQPLQQQQQQPQTNGFADDGLDEEERGKIRPADIDADVREMERRKRVEMIMNSRLFREELERIFDTQMKEGGAGPGGLLQQLSDMMGHGGPRGNVFRSSSCVIPINDIRGLESMGYGKGEKNLRCKLASVYRLMDLYGWTQGIHNHITARLNQDEEHFLVNPWGMLYHEITASSLVKVDMQGNIVEKGTTNFGINRDSFQLHSAIHAARPDIKCIIHIHTNSVLAVSSLKCGLLPLCQESCVIGEVSSHQYQGGLFEPEERDKISRNLGPNNKVLFLTNHGAMCCGETVEEAFFNVYNTVQACESQIKLMPMGVDNLVLLTDETRKRVYDAARRPPDGFVLDKTDKEKDKEVTSPTIAAKGKRWGVGGTEFEALMRMLDNAGFRTGYIYRHPLIKGEPPRPRNDVEVPPAVSSLGYLLEEEELYRLGGWKKWAEGRKTHDRTRWLNSPNVYQKVEILETGTPDPKKITKWVADGSPTHSSTPVKIDTLQFVPKNTNPKEFKRLQQQIKENRRADKITSGPQSHILEGVSWEEAKKLQDANISQTGDQVILVGAASKGIIQRGFQHNAMVYKTPYAKNPFDTITDDELEEYKKTVQRKARGEPYDEDQSESEALSSSAAGRPPTGKSPTSPISDDESRDECRVLRIESKQAPRPIHAEVVLSDDKKEMREHLNNPSEKPHAGCTLQRPPHFHHAAYISLPYQQSASATPCPSLCSITRFSKVGRQVPQKQEVSHVVSCISLPKVLPSNVCTEIIDDDVDSLADVASLPSSDAGCLDENHNETFGRSDIEIVKVKLQSLSEVQNVRISSVKGSSVPKYMLSISNESLPATSGSTSPLEIWDETIIPKNDSLDNSTSELGTEVTEQSAAGDKRTGSRTECASLRSKIIGESAMDDVIATPKNGAIDFHDKLTVNEMSVTEIVDCCGNGDSQITSDQEEAGAESVQRENFVPNFSSEGGAPEELQDGCRTCQTSDDTQDPLLQENANKVAYNSRLVLNHSSREALETDVNIVGGPFSNEGSPLSLTDLPEAGRKVLDVQCNKPHLESLSSDSKSIICIGTNEKVDFYSMVTLDQDSCNATNAVFLEDVIATRSTSGDVVENDNVDCFLHEDSTSKFWDFEPSIFPYFHDISRSNLEIFESLNSPRSSNATMVTAASELEDEGNQTVPNGAGETMYDPTGTCSEEFGSPLTAYSSFAFASDSGEEYYSPCLLAKSNSEPEDDDLWSTIEESDIEIDCHPFSRNSSMPGTPSNALQNKPMALSSDDRWPSFVTLSEDVGFSESEKCAGVDLDDASTICDESEDESQLDLGRGKVLSKHSCSTPFINSLCNLQSSPLELGRLFTLKKTWSASEPQLTNINY